jgi:hypothetical protein
MCTETSEFLFIREIELADGDPVPRVVGRPFLVGQPVDACVWVCRDEHNARIGSLPLLIKLSFHDQRTKKNKERGTNQQVESMKADRCDPPAGRALNPSPRRRVRPG